ncbi:hemolysin [Methylophaga lonarensis MPL]|uniref:Hemolysin n=1 Tax=Methylophaga lonarensis MPL TaxID=1286106 RepID=M7PSD4_9GAMM|nr:BON domain-containing protein [Methylophaga lonarensis]EMR13329.1 hemolysin [Methylophaga lonarensis MPL]
MKKLCVIGLMLLPVLASQQACVPVVATGATTAVAMAYDRRTAGSIIDDQNITLRGRSAIINNDEINRQSNISINSFNGVVLITGETPTEEVKQQVTAIIKDIPKVRVVRNELAIAAPSALTSRSSDAWITSKVKARMTGDQNVDPLHVRVVTERGIVYLMGMVTRAEAEDAVRVARTTSGVQRVIKVFEYVTE